MRQRNIKNLQEKLDMNSSFLIENPKELKGRWHAVFGNDNPICLEIGCGKGRFITSRAMDHPEQNYIAIEGQSNVVLRALQKAEENSIANLRIFITYVSDLKEYFDEGELSTVYLNFSDPWPKARHAKRRLTYRDRLKNYKEVLSPGGFIEFKTDNDGLFEFTLGEIEAAGFEIIEATCDLHGDMQDNISGERLVECSAELTGERSVFAADAAAYLTEYEEKFMALGKNINYVRF